ncbi:helix-turn-helix transcriptional regulator [Malikia granosa]|uniref:helix-turn-helix transcriptional regulator n=1 Tax=Malikia granosa TaxID=263067 RepID=UPI001B80727D|nr:transcriptional regulator [Malikia granosa]
MALLRKPQTKAEMGYRSDTSITNAIKAGLLTKPVPIGPRALGWPDDEIRAINAARIAGKTDDEIRALVEHLQGQRAIKFERLMGWMPPDAAPELAGAGRVAELRRGC